MTGEAMDDEAWLRWALLFRSLKPPTESDIERFKEKVGGHESDGVGIFDARVRVFNEMFKR
jgi:hypothetical protein